LRSHKLLADTDGRVLVSANSAEQDLSFSSFGVEKPQIPFHCQRYGRRPVFRAYVQSDGAIGFSEKAMHLLVLANEVRMALGVLNWVTRRDDLRGVRSKDLEHRFFIVVLYGGQDSFARFFRLRKCFLTLLLTCGIDGKARE
jgi:hypothetical protein